MEPGSHPARGKNWCMSDSIEKLTIEGFKSIRELKNFELRPLNVLIGANGAGKSNFVGFFRLLRELIEQRLQVALQTTEGGADACLYMGPKTTKRFAAKLHFGYNGYEFVLEPTPDNRMVFADEATWFVDLRDRLGSGRPEARLKDLQSKPGKRGGEHAVRYYVYKAISSWVVCHFHDTSLTAGVRRQKPINDNDVLRPDAENLAAFLYRMRAMNPGSYTQIREVVRISGRIRDSCLMSNYEYEGLLFSDPRFFTEAINQPHLAEVFQRGLPTGTSGFWLVLESPGRNNRRPWCRH